MTRVVVDLDGTLTHLGSGTSYADAEPNLAAIEQLRAYRDQGFGIVIYTARNMRSHSNSIGKINATTLPTILTWLAKHNVPYDEIHVGKPWCGDGAFYVDDCAIRPDEFTNLPYEAIRKLVAK